MEEGAFRADTNVSVKKKGASKLGTRCELKNINSFKFIGDAVEYEIERQIELLERGEKVVQETRSWDTKEHKTVPLRSKEEAADYRYFADPDLSKIIIDQSLLEKVKSTMPELPDAKLDRLCREYGLTLYEADILINDAPLAAYYEAAASHFQSKHLINWVLRDVVSFLKENKLEITTFKVSPSSLAELIALVEKGVINARTAQDVFAEIAQTGSSPAQIVTQKGLEQVGSSEELEAIIKEIIAANPQQVSDYKSGKDKLFGFFVGQAMAKTKGKGNPAIINELLKKHLQ
jgi:aspartyl-tRNA(Asn)/glutamyl-tRNA(Gln) amidotransferase subunit B